MLGSSALVSNSQPTAEAMRCSFTIEHFTLATIFHAQIVKALVTTTHPNPLA